jgi:photosystem I P700 chlorophyll a apoprotein A2
MTEKLLYRQIFASHFGHLAIIFLWTSGNFFHVAWQGNYEQWIINPLKTRPIAHAIWDPHFGEYTLKAFTRSGASYPVTISTSGLYHWWYTIGLRTNNELYNTALGLILLSGAFLFAGWLHLQNGYRPRVEFLRIMKHD